MSRAFSGLHSIRERCSSCLLLNGAILTDSTGVNTEPLENISGRLQILQISLCLNINDIIKTKSFKGLPIFGVDCP